MQRTTDKELKTPSRPVTEGVLLNSIAPHWCNARIKGHTSSRVEHDAEWFKPEASVPAPLDFDALSKAEQVRYLQSLWNQISEDPGALPVPESHLRLAEERLKRYREDSSRSHSLSRYSTLLADTSSTDSKSK